MKGWVDILRDYLWAQVVVYNRDRVFSHFLEGIIAAVEGMKVSQSNLKPFTFLFYINNKGSMEAEYQDARVYSKSMEHD